MGRLCIKGHSYNNLPYSLRDEKTGACLECLRSIADRSVAFDINQIPVGIRTKAAQFLSTVYRPETQSSQVDFSACWPFHGRGNPYGHKVKVPWDMGTKKRTTPPRFLYFLIKGDIGNLPISKTCGNAACCNPFHQYQYDFEPFPLLSRPISWETKLDIEKLRRDYANLEQNDLVTKSYA